MTRAQVYHESPIDEHFRIYPVGQWGEDYGFKFVYTGKHHFCLPCHIETGHYFWRVNLN